jgi:hypothetical protein
MTTRIVGAAALLVAAAVHVAQLVSIFHAVPWVGPLFAADAVLSTAIAVALLTRWWRVAAPAGALVSAGALAGLALASTVGLFGWQESVLRPSVQLAIGSELVAFAALAPLALPAPRLAGALVPRVVAGGGLAAIAGLHIAAAGAEWDDARTMFWLFIALAAVCLALAARLARGLDAWSWPAVFALAVVPLAGYVLSRWTGVPGGDAEDVGDWANSLGVAAVAVEAALGIYAAVNWRSAMARNARAAGELVPVFQASAVRRMSRGRLMRRT